MFASIRFLSSRWLSWDGTSAHRNRNPFIGHSTISQLLRMFHTIFSISVAIGTAPSYCHCCENALFNGWNKNIERKFEMHKSTKRTKTSSLRCFRLEGKCAILIQSVFVWWRSNNVNSFQLAFKALGAFAHEAFHSRVVLNVRHRKQMECGSDISWKTNFKSFRWKHFIKLKSPLWFQMGSNKAKACSKICSANFDDHVITRHSVWRRQTNVKQLLVTFGKTRSLIFKNKEVGTWLAAIGANSCVICEHCEHSGAAWH